MKAAPDPEHALDAWMDDTLAPFADLAPQLLEEMRVLMRATLASHPVANQLMGELIERAPQQVSGVVGDDDGSALRASGTDDKKR